MIALAIVLGTVALYVLVGMAEYRRQWAFQARQKARGIKGTAVRHGWSGCNYGSTNPYAFRPDECRCGAFGRDVGLMTNQSSFKHIETGYWKPEWLAVMWPARLTLVSLGIPFMLFRLVVGVPVGRVFVKVMHPEVHVPDAKVIAAMEAELLDAVIRRDA